MRIREYEGVPTVSVNGRSCVERQCDVCGQTYFARVSELRGGVGRTCSRDCAHYAWSDRLVRRSGRATPERWLKLRMRSAEQHYAHTQRLRHATSREQRAEITRRVRNARTLEKYHEDPDNWSTMRKRRRIFERDGWRCRVCGVKVRTDVPRSHPQRATAMHIVAKATGGEWSADNIATGCHSCNVRDGVNQSSIQMHLNV